jgi:uncharacterized membrane protein
MTAPRLSTPYIKFMQSGRRLDVSAITFFRALTIGEATAVAPVDYARLGRRAAPPEQA